MRYVLIALLLGGCAGTDYEQLEQEALQTGDETLWEKVRHHDERLERERRERQADAFCHEQGLIRACLAHSVPSDRTCGCTTIQDIFRH